MTFFKVQLWKKICHFVIWSCWLLSFNIQILEKSLKHRSLCMSIITDTDVLLYTYNSNMWHFLIPLWVTEAIILVDMPSLTLILSLISPKDSHNSMVLWGHFSFLFFRRIIYVCEKWIKWEIEGERDFLLKIILIYFYWKHRFTERKDRTSINWFIP